MFIGVSRLTTSKSAANPAILASFAIGVPHQDRNNHYSFEWSPHPDVIDDDRAHDLLRTLDGHSLGSEGETWEVVILGIHTVGSHRWIQIVLDGPTSEHLVLRIADRADGAEALHAIRAWIEAPSRTERLLRVD